MCNYRVQKFNGTYDPTAKKSQVNGKVSMKTSKSLNGDGVMVLVCA
jgi:hypothetical protein